MNYSENVRKKLKAVAVVCETNSGELSLLFLNQSRCVQTKLALKQAGMIAEEAEEVLYPELGVYQIKILPSQTDCFLKLLPRADHNEGDKLVEANLAIGNILPYAEHVASPLSGLGRPFTIRIASLSENIEILKSFLDAAQDLYSVCNPTDFRALF